MLILSFLRIKYRRNFEVMFSGMAPWLLIARGLYCQISAGGSDQRQRVLELTAFATESDFIA